MDKLKSLTDEDLVNLYAQGNNLAFDVLLDRHKTSLYSYIYFTVKNSELAEDLFQETFVKVILTIKKGRYVENGKFKAWITRIAHNLIIDSFRQEKYENYISNDESKMDLLNDIRLCDRTVEDKMMKRQLIDDIRNLIDFLPENQKEVLIMRYYQNLSFKDISERTGVSINTALGRMRYAILNMRRLVKDNRIELAV